MVTILSLDKLWGNFGWVFVFVMLVFFFLSKTSKTIQQLPVAGRNKMRMIMTLNSFKKKDVWQLAHAYQESNISSSMCVAKWKDPPQKPWKFMESLCASWGSSVLWLWHQWEKGAWELGNKLSVNKYSAILEESNGGRRAGSVCQASQWKTHAVKVQKILWTYLSK